MGAHSGPDINENGLVLALDGTNPNNYNLTEIEYLIVAGGGSGGIAEANPAGDGAGGGGGGGVITNIGGNFLSISPNQSYTIIVGNGGVNSSGGNSSAFGLTAFGGGKGGNVRNAGVTTGGSGGGAGGNCGQSNRTGGAGTAGQGNRGGNDLASTGDCSLRGGRGGGGAGSAASDAASAQGTSGGNGIVSYISGTETYYAGGGGGGRGANNGVGGSGGSGGGGSGSNGTASPVAGTNNTGGGGGGGASYSSGVPAPGQGANGGSGIVIVRYPGPQKAIGGTVTSVNGYTIHSFTTTGSTTFTPLSATNNSSILGVSDFSGNNRFATSVNGTTYSTSNLGSLSFDGVDDYLSTSLTGTFPQITFDYWGFFDDITLSTTSRNESAFGDWTNGRVHWGTRWSVGMHWNVNSVWVETPATNLRYGWNHFSLIWNHTAGQRLIYINGILSTSSTTNGNMVLGDFRIGVATNLNAYYRGNISNFKVYNRALTENEVKQNFNSLKGRYYIFDYDGSSPSRAAPNASYLVSLGITTDGVYWINLPTVGPTQIYCILNPAYDGGGWMMAMKATRGTTFNYSANYWTTANTLNPTQTNRNDGDAKFDSMNYFEAKDMMAIWPDISNGGSIPSSTLGWTWLQNNFNDGTKITPISFFGITYPTMNTGGSGKFIQDAKTYSGWASGVFSSQVDIRFYGFNYINNPNYGTQVKVRWGFGWNENGEGLYPSSGGAAPGSNDVTGGIGLDTGGGSYSAGDRINCCQDTIGINRSARVEVYIR